MTDRERGERVRETEREGERERERSWVRGMLGKGREYKAVRQREDWLVGWFLNVLVNY